MIFTTNNTVSTFTTGKLTSQIKNNTSANTSIGSFLKRPIISVLVEAQDHYRSYCQNQAIITNYGTLQPLQVISSLYFPHDTGPPQLLSNSSVLMRALSNASKISKIARTMKPNQCMWIQLERKENKKSSKKNNTNKT